MRNLFEFIWRNQFTLIFLILEVIGFFLLSSTNSFHQSKLYSTSVAISGEIYSINQSYEQYIGLLEENEQLKSENAMLRERLFNIASIEEPLKKSYETIPATVIKSTFSWGNNFIIIDKGSDDGVNNEMGVLSSDGIVGRVVHVSSSYAAIMPILHSQSVTSVQLKNNNYFGRCKWNQFDSEVAQMLDIPNHVKVTEGDTIVTRGSNGIFPSGEIVGYVISTKKDPSEGFQEINFKLATNFQKLKAVYIIKNNNKAELDSLVQDVKDDFQWEEN